MNELKSKITEEGFKQYTGVLAIEHRALERLLNGEENEYLKAVIKQAKEDRTKLLGGEELAKKLEEAIDLSIDTVIQTLSNIYNLITKLTNE